MLPAAGPRQAAARSAFASPHPLAERRVSQQGPGHQHQAAKGQRGRQLAWAEPQPALRHCGRRKDGGHLRGGGGSAGAVMCVEVCVCVCGEARHSDSGGLELQGRDCRCGWMCPEACALRQGHAAWRGLPTFPLSRTRGHATCMAPPPRVPACLVQDIEQECYQTCRPRAHAEAAVRQPQCWGIGRHAGVPGGRAVIRAGTRCARSP